MNLETPPADLQELLDTIENMPMGDEELELVRTALARAEELELPGWSYVLRLWFNRSTFRMGETDSLFSSFTRTLAIHDSDPERFPLSIDEDTHLLFQYKWVAEMLNDSPAYSLGQIHNVYADMERRFRQAGASLSGYYQTRFAGACSRGEWDDAEHLFSELQIAPRDNLSHCEACYRSTAALYFADRGNTDHALELLEEIFSGQYVCGDEPEFSESQAMFMYLKKGDLEQARHLHYKSLATIRQHPDPGSMLHRHVEFSILTGNTARALSLVEQYPRMFECSPLNVARQFESLTLLGLLSDALIKDGRAETPIHGSDSHHFALLLTGVRPTPGDELTAYTPQQLADQVWERAATIAQGFNARNGNDHYTGRLEDRKALLNTRYDLPLGVEQYEDEPLPVLAVAEPENLDDYLGAIGDAMPANLARATHLFRTFNSEGSPAGSDTAGVLGADIAYVALGTNWNEATELGLLTYSEIADAFSQHGYSELAHITTTFHSKLAESQPDGTAQELVRILGTLDANNPEATFVALAAAEAFSDVDASEALKVLDAHIRQQAGAQEVIGAHTAHNRGGAESSMNAPAGASTFIQARWLLARAESLIRLGDFTSATHDLAHAEPLVTGHRALEVRTDVAHAMLASQLDLWDQALESYDNALNKALAGQDHASAWAILMMKGRSQGTIERHQDAARSIQRALKHARIAGAKEAHISELNYVLGVQLINAGFPQEAISPLTDALNWHLEQDTQPELIAMHLAALGEAAARGAEVQQAFSAWNYGRAFAQENGLPHEEYGFLSRIVGLLTEIEHPQVPEFTHDLYKVACALNDPTLIAESAQRSAVAQAVVMKSSDLTIVDKAVEYITEQGLAEPQNVDVIRIEMAVLKAQLVAQLGDGERALANALDAVQLAQAAHIDEAQADALTLAGLISQQLERPDQAREYFTSALALSQGADVEFLHARIAELDS